MYLSSAYICDKDIDLFSTALPLSPCPQVCTGVYNPERPLPCDQSSVTTETLVPDPHLAEPSHIVEDVEAAVDLLLEQESALTCEP